jgi:ABC-type nickel/cobalt efflux system permease component RcnA
VLWLKDALGMLWMVIVLVMSIGLFMTILFFTVLRPTKLDKAVENRLVKMELFRSPARHSFLVA